MAKILIVDDDEDSRYILQRSLRGDGHDLVEAGSGHEAVTRARVVLPDLVLLDVRLPDLSGFDVAQQLKAQAGLRFLPILLVTAFDEGSWREQGLSIGADEVLHKPVDRRELRLRVEHLLKLRREQETLAKRNLELVELQRFRDEMTTLLVHDLKNPLASVISNVEFALDPLSSDVDKSEALVDIGRASQRMLSLLTNLLDLAKLEQSRLQIDRGRVAIGQIVDVVLSPRAHAIRRRELRVEKGPTLGEEIAVDSDLLRRVLENIVDNALRYAPSGGRLVFDMKRDGEGFVRVEIGNSGPAIPKDARDRVFEKFGQASNDVGRTNLGLGLYFCRLVAEAHGGRIWIEERPHLPTVFVIALRDSAQ